jgi:hypothetical protein
MLERKKIIPLVLLSLSALSLSVSGQVPDHEKSLKAPSDEPQPGWKKGGLFTVNLAQNSLTNWSAGGQNSLAVNGLLSLHANFGKGKSRWDNSLELGYGLLKDGNYTGFRKTEDKIDFLSKYGWKAIDGFYFSGLINFKTQMNSGYDYIDESTQKRISAFFAPAYLQAALGFDYKPVSHLSAFMAPLSAKFTFVLDKEFSEAGAFGVEPGQALKSEMGGYLRLAYSRSDFKSDILKGVSLTMKLDLFSNYLDHPENVDVSWETLIGLKVNKLLSVNLNTHLIYDADTLFPAADGSSGVAKVQFKEIFGAGLALNF